jgi:signal transduction histidine kinase
MDLEQARDRDWTGGVEGCGVGRPCPISRTACPGECIYADVMESQRLGVVVFDQGRSSLHFVNRFARDLFRSVRREADYATLSGLLLTPGPDGDSDRPARTLQIGSRLLGYTVYRARSFAWVYVRDITAKARLESIAEAVETMNNIGYVFAAVRHELGNPINSVKAALSVLSANLDTYPKQMVAEYLERIGSEVARVENLLRSLKSFSLYERPALQAVEVGAFLQQFVQFVSEDTRKNGISVEVAVSCECWARCDPRALQQVMLNLYANASDALRQHDRPVLRILLSKRDGLITIWIADNGPGIPELEAQQLFQPFFTTKESGTGLGLVISRKLLAKMGGTITVDSKEGRGTSVHVSLPESSACPQAP